MLVQEGSRTPGTPREGNVCLARLMEPELSLLMVPCLPNRKRVFLAHKDPVSSV